MRRGKVLITKYDEKVGLHARSSRLNVLKEFRSVSPFGKRLAQILVVSIDWSLPIGTHGFDFSTASHVMNSSLPLGRNPFGVQTEMQNTTEFNSGVCQ